MKDRVKYSFFVFGTVILTVAIFIALYVGINTFGIKSFTLSSDEYAKYGDIFKLFISSGITILGFFLVVFIYLLTILRPNAFTTDESDRARSRFIVSHKMSSFVYPFGFISFLLVAYPLSISSLIVIFDGNNVLSSTIEVLSIMLYVLFIKVFQRSTSKIVPFWELHRQSYHKKFVYFLINSINILIPLSAITLVLPIFNQLERIGYSADVFFITVLVLSLLSLWGFIYFLIQNAGFIYVVGTDYVLHEIELGRLRIQLDRLAKSTHSDYAEIRNKWEYLYPKTTAEANIDLDELNSDITKLQRLSDSYDIEKPKKKRKK